MPTEPVELGKITLTEADLQLAYATAVLRRSCSFYAATEMTDALPHVLMPFIETALKTPFTFDALLAQLRTSLNFTSPPSSRNSVDPLRVWLSHALEPLRNLFEKKLLNCIQKKNDGNKDGCENVAETKIKKGKKKISPPIPYFFRTFLFLRAEEIFTTAICHHLQITEALEKDIEDVQALLDSLEIPPSITVFGETLDLQATRQKIRTNFTKTFGRTLQEWKRLHALRTQMPGTDMIFNPPAETSSSSSPSKSHKKKPEAIPARAQEETPCTLKNRSFADPSRCYRLKHKLKPAVRKTMEGIGDAVFTICRGVEDCPQYLTLTAAATDFTRHPELVIVKTTDNHPRFFKVDERMIEPFPIATYFIPTSSPPPRCPTRRGRF